MDNYSKGSPVIEEWLDLDDNEAESGGYGDPPAVDPNNNVEPRRQKRVHQPRYTCHEILVKQGFDGCQELMRSVKEAGIHAFRVHRIKAFGCGHPNCTFRTARQDYISRHEEGHDTTRSSRHGATRGKRCENSFRRRHQLAQQRILELQARILALEEKLDVTNAAQNQILALQAKIACLENELAITKVAQVFF
ncbi:hypothetical protein TWF730_010033 [Orbilia blumenaviensis]|uniref:C2H2-type domain-containing protein n=1 Tax=Orbilia blumenaviensis TaxID=1796055 RepID=A0AAV9UU96_9PEZI